MESQRVRHDLVTEQQQTIVLHIQLLPKSSILKQMRWFFKYSSVFSQSAVQFNSVQSLSRVSLFATPWIAARQAPPCPSPTPGVYSNSCPSSRWCHPAISSSVIPSSSCPQSLPASRSFPMSESEHTHKTKISIAIRTIVFCPWCFKSLDSSSVLINGFLHITHHIFKFSMKYSSRIRFFIQRAFTAVFITRAKIWKQPNCPTMDVQTKKTWSYICICTHKHTAHWNIIQL